MKSKLHDYIDEYNDNELDSIVSIKIWQKKVAGYLNAIDADEIDKKFADCMNAEYMSEMNDDEIDHWEILSEQIGLLSGYLDKQDAQESVITLKPHSAKEHGLGKRSEISENANTGSPSKSLERIIKRHDIETISSEFERALNNISSSLPDAVLAACTILESICRIYIEDHDHLKLPKKLSLDKSWNIVRKDLGFDPKKNVDQDLQKILTGLISIVNGTGSLRTHAGSAHGAGRMRYNLEPRHARLAVHAAHTVAAFIMESWEKKDAP